VSFKSGFLQLSSENLKNLKFGLLLTFLGLKT